MRFRVNQIKKDEAFKESLNPTYKMLYQIGVETGLRVGDILRIKRENLVGDKICIIEEKTGKYAEKKVSNEVVNYINSFPVGEKLFKMTRQAVWKYYKNKAKKLRLKRVGTHSMRKKYANNMYKESHDIKKVQKEMNHDFIGTTLVYLLEDD